ncbi:MAG: hypothetical protein QOH56_3943 [Pseudonocardiales bacterium]|jgi:hypothetical protein|nr:hypothetical protein [Frankiales bacterium]MDQ1737692.1 hypothetical protein [Pseudonocardiales bacterium]
MNAAGEPDRGDIRARNSHVAVGSSDGHGFASLRQPATPRLER